MPNPEIQAIIDNARTALDGGASLRGYRQLALAYQLSVSLSHSEKREAMGGLRALRPSHPALERIVDDIRAEVLEIERILSIGEVFQPEETLALAMRWSDLRNLVLFFEAVYAIDLRSEIDRLDSFLGDRFKMSTDKRIRKIVK